jgi:hypothetical protein
LGDAGPLDFYDGSNYLGGVAGSQLLTATTPPAELILTNLPEGESALSARYRGGNRGLANVPQVTVRAAKLGINPVAVSTKARFEFEIVTSFPGAETIIRASTNLLEWTAVSTNTPATERFSFFEPVASAARRWYRAMIPAN